jgi:signal transduction histidine kinase
MSQQNVIMLLPQAFGELNENDLALIRSMEGQIIRQRNLTELMDTIWELTINIIPHDRIGLAFIDDDKQRIVAQYSKSVYSPLLLEGGFSAGLANSTLQPMLETGMGRIINNLEAYFTTNPESVSTQLLVLEGVRSNLTLPLSVDGRHIGFVFFSSRQPNAFCMRHGALLLAMLQVMSAGIEKAWLINRLQQANLDYSTLMGFVSHELKSPLSTMMMLGHTYVDGYLGPVDALAQDTIDKMLRISGYLVNMISNYLGLSSLESGELKFDPMPSLDFEKEVLGVAIETIQARIKEHHVQLEVNGCANPQPLLADFELLRLVVVNLLDNAVKYGERNSVVSVRCEYTAQSFVFAVRNKGVGFTKEQSQKLFKRFSRLRQKGLEDRKGSGLGLYLSWWVIQKHNGRIYANSQPGEWAEFVFEIPII